MNLLWLIGFLGLQLALAIDYRMTGPNFFAPCPLDRCDPAQGTFGTGFFKSPVNPGMTLRQNWMQGEPAVDMAAFKPCALDFCDPARGTFGTGMKLMRRSPGFKTDPSIVFGRARRFQNSNIKGALDAIHKNRGGLSGGLLTTPLERNEGASQAKNFYYPILDSNEGVGFGGLEYV